MTEATVAATPAAVPAPKPEPVMTTLDPAAKGKEAIYQKIAMEIERITNKRFGKTNGQKLFNFVVEQVFAEATKDPATPFRFNGGFGSMHIKTYQAGTRRLPSGQETTFGERQKLRYEEGVVVEALVKNKGDLVEAIKVRGTRTKPEAATGAGGNGAAGPATSSDDDTVSLT